MVDSLRLFAAEVTRVAKEVGTDGQLGGQAYVINVSGEWKSLVDSVNQMCGNLTDQVRSIAKATTAVAKGDLTQKVMIEANGEVLQLVVTINEMVDRVRPSLSRSPHDAHVQVLTRRRRRRRAARHVRVRGDPGRARGRH